MDLEHCVSDDVWNVVKDNYGKGSYTTAITNVLQYVNEVVRDKSGLSLDNTKLMEQAFLGSNPKLKINKFQTQTEKDIQQGVGFLLKGLCLTVRNPRAHARYNDNNETADIIILFVNYILEFIRDSKQPALVEDWLDFIFDENFNDTKMYAEYVLKELPQNKRYDLLVNIFRLRERAKPRNLNNLVNLLMENITPDEFKEFIDNINKELLFCKDDDDLRMFLSLYSPEKWNLLVPLTKLKIENMVEESFEAGKMLYDNGNYECNRDGELSTWAVDFINYFEIKDDFLDLAGVKLRNSDEDVRNFINIYFKDLLFNSNNLEDLSLQFGIKQSLKYFDKRTYEIINPFCLTTDNDSIKAIFKKELDLAKKHFDKENETKDIVGILSDDDLPF